MANYEKIVAIPASLEDDFHRFLQKGNGITKKKELQVPKEDYKPIKAILKKPAKTESSIIVRQVKRNKTSVNKAVEKKTKKQITWLEL